MKTKGILVVSFGTSILNVMNLCIKSTEDAIRCEFKDYDVRRAFTSGIIISKLKKDNNIYVDTVGEALLKKIQDGIEDVYIQPLHIIPGDEYDKLVSIAENYKSRLKKLVIGRPILYREDDYRIAVKAFKNMMPSYDQNSEALVLMGHGSSHPINASYSMLQNVFYDSGMKNVFIATVEGYPVLKNVIASLNERRLKGVVLMPFMLVAGNHVVEDMCGTDKNSWKNILQDKGFKTRTYLHGLGENPAFHSIYIQHIKDSIKGNPLMKGEKI